ncbi:alpha/beta-hydrolase [Cylindrobasidium torrendii FP15055 ss-10]|uniref:Carboxylic ester hydrolase n=1 Tax=Cylindrobasidium torrendii FP15055 ss-10 TaxID=1314674 RepID=A0A0D7AUR1_9AGAR|nr:alpha/beta-hydrolase [Cylindrobasidium torrendii FP15055 ss-10]
MLLQLLFGLHVQLQSQYTTSATPYSGIDKFLGIPFGKAPIGNLRFNLPEAVDAYTGTIEAIEFGPACPQQEIKLPILDGLPQEAVDYILNSIYNVVFPSDEDCLSINVVRPSNVSETSNLPVVVIGGTSMYDGASIVSRSVELGEPVVYVSMNYRVSAFGFLASQEVKDAGVGNLGLLDQRLALRWIQKYIAVFGGNPEKVTIWGESAGAISVASQMLMNDGDNEGLFHAGFMQSGSPIPVGDITHGQADYDTLVEKTGCSGEDDTLACLREVDYDTLKAAVDDSPFVFDYQALLLAWLPRADGLVFSDNPQKLVQAGKIANVPIVNGDVDDEGTLFSLSQLNVTTDDEFRTYLSNVFLQGAGSDEDIDTILGLYPSDPSVGSPYDTGSANAITPQFKRIASFQGDAVFQGPRRFFLNALSGKTDVWSYAHKKLKGVPVLGSFHASDVLDVYGGGDLVDYLVHFATHLDPNGANSTAWPKWTSASPQLLSINDIGVTVIDDTFRQDAIETLTGILLNNPV